MDENESSAGTSRRDLLKTAGKLTFGGALAALVFRRPLKDLVAGVELPSPDHQSVPGACHQPQTRDEKLLAAMADTIVPGKESDPEGLPGALESCVLNLVHDEFYPFVQTLPAILLLVNNTADLKYSKDFVDLKLTERTAVLKEAEDKLPLVRLAYRFFRSSFYAAVYNMEGGRYLSWPGPNLGYSDHPEMSFRKPIGKELTRDGNLP